MSRQDLDQVKTGKRNSNEREVILDPCSLVLLNSTFQNLIVVFLLRASSFFCCFDNNRRVFYIRFYFESFKINSNSTSQNLIFVFLLSMILRATSFFCCFIPGLINNGPVF